ncbi:F0F1 ATP synthase subunit A [Phenylobacterium parvum]|jgi:F-type H+-transporting ATPase subunit a|uniref:ATP synthase subunit a n=1 Tax=Phenylobacterium parvum TaxID=2201350 RepID=A0A2Z3HTS6_9CAUL|nr:F0F1 ATP synthase subunit A [Phenylobacterium parvum]AWM76730.1 F0F1 ATP synthase subunit A [Phenylobacterium parvum]
MASPMEQFEIHKGLQLPTVELPGGLLVDLSLNNSILAMLIAAGLVVAFFAVATSRAAVVPGRMQLMAEGLFSYIDDMAHGIIGHESRKFFPYVFTIFLFVLSMNMLGLFLAFTATSQLAVTATLAVLTFLIVLVVGFIRNGANMYKLFVPSGVPWYMLFLVTPIEIISFFLRPVTLALRLFGNMLGGHVALKVFAGFIPALAGLGAVGVVGAVLPLVGVVALTSLEFLVAFLQAFVFAVLTCVYLNDVVNLGDHH